MAWAVGCRNFATLDNKILLRTETQTQSNIVLKNFQWKINIAEKNQRNFFSVCSVNVIIKLVQFFISCKYILVVQLCGMKTQLKKMNEKNENE